ncbi:MAG: NADH-quinone oxidoreductase subunit M [Gemmataceae bacterium]|nr:NADH-quinone oxidoreductase subunit M [Gemmata sp.]MDW8198144.1 NADH-quinone oxidoreductase subunit M [Gemmataceae bacterium]
MSITAVLRIVVLLLVLMPLVSALILPMLGRWSRRAALLLALVHGGLTAAVVALAIPTLALRADDDARRGSGSLVFQPEFVPGDTYARFNDEGSDGRTRWTLFRLSANSSQPGPNIQFFLGIDGLNLWLVALASFLLVPAILISWNTVADQPGSYFGWLFLLQAGLIGCFLAFDVILFYVFFELTLIPAFFLIGRWGVGSGRRDAARKFFLYTLAGSLLTLLGIIGVVLTNPVPVHPETGFPTQNVLVKVEVPDAGSPTGKSREFVWAKRIHTFSLPDLMNAVPRWLTAEKAAQTALTEAQREMELAQALVRAGEKELAQRRAALEAARQGKDGAAIRAAEAAEQHALQMLNDWRANWQAAVRLSDSATKLLPEARRLQANASQLQFWLFVALMAGLMVKVPVWPFHTWLPAAYGEAPIGVVMLLSGLMAKLGTFGMVRLVLPLVPDAAIHYGLPVIGVLASVGIVYAAFCALASKDMKLLIAYSSISHLGFLVLGIFAFNSEGLSGAVLHMINHGLSTGALFAVLGFFTTRYGTTEMARFGGLMGRFPVLAVLTFVLALASVGLPGLNNFVSEMLMLAGLFRTNNPHVTNLWPAVVAAFGIFLGAWYTLTMLQRVFFNPLKEPQPIITTPVNDVNNREFSALGLLALLCLVLGLFPQLVLDTMKPDIQILANIGDAARTR